MVPAQPRAAPVARGLDALEGAAKHAEGVVDVAATLAPSAAEAEAPRGGGECVLLVEDDDVIRQRARRTQADAARALAAREQLHKLSKHLSAEERYLLPLYAAAEPREAAALLAEHDTFRKALDELG